MTLNLLHAHRITRLRAYLTFALAAWLIAALHTYHFSGRPYRQDETWSIHLAVVSDTPQDIVLYLANDQHPPFWTLVLSWWIDIAGHHENMTRFMSTLGTLLTLALTYRWGRAVFGRRAALLAVIVLGTAPLFVFHSHEARAYSALGTGAVALQWGFWRWLHQPTFKRALFVVGVGVATLYTHLSALYLLLTLALALVIFVRWDWKLYLRAAGLIAAIGLSLLGWIVPFLHALLVINPQGLGYALETNWETVRFVYQAALVQPEGIRTLLLMVSVGAVLGWLPFGRIKRASVDGARFRWETFASYGYVGVMALVIVLLLVLNTVFKLLTTRVLIMGLPALALLVAVGLVQIPRRLQLVVIGVMIFFAVFNFIDYQEPEASAEIVTYLSDQYQPGDLIVLDLYIVWRTMALKYYLFERTPNPPPLADILDIVIPIVPSQYQMLPLMPLRPKHLLTTANVPDQAYFERFLARGQRIWYLQFPDELLNSVFGNWLDEHTVRASTMEFKEGYTVNLYTHTPQTSQDKYFFANNLGIQLWSVEPEVALQPCQDVTFTSLWAARELTATDYSLSLMLTDARGRLIAQSDGAPGDQPTSTWETTALYLDKRTLTAPCDLEAGEYALFLGMMDANDPSAWVSATTEDGTRLGSQAFVTTLDIQP